MTPGDYDGDTKSDISVYRDTTGTWYRLNSSTGTFVAQQFGVTGDEPVARDPERGVAAGLEALADRDGTDRGDVTRWSSREQKGGPVTPALDSSCLACCH